MRRFRAPAAVGVALVFLVLTAGPAFAPWKGLSDLNFDDGRICRDGIAFALADFGADNEHATVTNVTANPDVVLANDVALAQLHFEPVPELFSLGDYYFSASYRILFPQKVPAGTDLTIDFTGTHNTGTNLKVANCRLGDQPVSGFAGLLNPPGVNTVTTSDPIALEFALPGKGGRDIFTEDPLYAPIPCAPAQGVNPGYPDPVPQAIGTLSFNRSSGTYTYLWTPSSDLTGCQEVWFRLKKDGLQHRAMFDFGS
jgi:hypothetical protein